MEIVKCNCQCPRCKVIELLTRMDKEEAEYDAIMEGGGVGSIKEGEGITWYYDMGRRGSVG